MRITWLFLVSLLCLYLVSDVDSWRRRSFRFRGALPRIRVRRAIRRVRRLVRVSIRLPRVRRLVRLPSVKTILGQSILDKVVNIHEINIALTTHAPPVLPPDISGPEPEPAVPTCKEICAGNCPKTCTTWNCPCQWVCPTTCEIFKREEFLWPYDGFPAPLPCNFSQYDADNNTLISPWELAYQVRRRARDDNNMMVFNKMDVDRDGNLTPKEFKSFPLLKLKKRNITGFDICNLGIYV